MKDQGDAELTRRGLMRGAFRYAALSVLGAWGLTGAVKRRRLLREGACLNRGVCPACGVFADCGLPRARAIRAKRREHEDG